MTYYDFERDVTEQLDRLAYQGISVKKILFGPEELIALGQYPGPMVTMKTTDPEFGKRSFMGIEWAPSTTKGITFIHERK